MGSTLEAAHMVLMAGGADGALVRSCTFAVVALEFQAVSVGW